ncbi:unnamed protein product [Polarella glacialis]|uniref:Uncharacterized protein n=1 Tax=Polarella glacialis TaxID=89957 RepID=A0A813GVT7_POLGL|nr:unnamed protein product [Polarella glacialis]
MESQLDGELESNDVFVKLTEEARRERLRRIDAGEEGAALKFNNRAPQDSSPGPLKAIAPNAAGQTAIRPSMIQKGVGKGGPVNPQQQMLQQQQMQQQLRQKMMQQGQGQGQGMPMQGQGFAPRPAFGMRPGMPMAMQGMKGGMMGQQRFGQGWN